MSKIKLQIPSKTFLIGEYAVLGEQPSPAVILNTAPNFKVTVNLDGGNFESNFNPNSPANELLKQYGLKLDLNDPHNARGGFGGSGAEWISYGVIRKHFENYTHDLNPFELWQEIQELNPSQASGLDVISQLTGKVALIDKINQTNLSIDWPFEDVRFSIIRTGNNVPTHDHLKKIDETDLTLLKTLSQKGYDAMQDDDAPTLMQCINAYHDTMVSLNLCHKDTQTLITNIKSSDLFLATKGSGAMGADTIVLLYTIDKQEDVKKYFNDNNLEHIATSADLTEFSWEVE